MSGYAARGSGRGQRPAARGQRAVGDSVDREVTVTKEAKSATRATLLAVRQARSPEERAAAGTALAARLLDLAEVGTASTVAAYWSFGGEPPTHELVTRLAADRTVLLPVGRPDDDVDWAPYGGTMRAGLWRFAEPDGPRLGTAAVGGADVVLAPALAVDRAGNRLGRGKGCYDRVLTRVPSGVPVVAVVYDDELVDELPTEPHDRRVDVVVTPSGVHRLR